MNQTPAAMLILAASICAHSVASRPTYDSFTAMIGIAAVALALWGMAALVKSFQLQSEMSRDKTEPEGLASRAALRNVSPNGLRDGFVEPDLSAMAGDPVLDDDLPDGQQLSPEVSAQLAVVAHQQGKHRTQIVDEVLRKHLPRYTQHRVA